MMLRDVKNQDQQKNKPPGFFFGGGATLNQLVDLPPH